MVADNLERSIIVVMGYRLDVDDQGSIPGKSRELFDYRAQNKRSLYVV
jgi:ribosome modulation factor